MEGGYEYNWKIVALVNLKKMVVIWRKQEWTNTRSKWKELLCDFVNDLIWKMKAGKKWFKDEYIRFAVQWMKQQQRQKKEGLLMVSVSGEVWGEDKLFVEHSTYKICVDNISRGSRTEGKQKWLQRSCCTWDGSDTEEDHNKDRRKPGRFDLLGNSHVVCGEEWVCEAVGRGRDEGECERNHQRGEFWKAVDQQYQMHLRVKENEDWDQYLWSIYPQND